MLNIGTASQLAVIKPSTCQLPHFPESVMEVPYFDHDTILVAASLSGGNVVSTFVKMLSSWLGCLQVSQHTDNQDSVPYLVPNESDIYGTLISISQEKMDTSLKVDVRLWGERHNPGVTGCVYNMAPHNLELGDVSSAMFRGIIENLWSMISQEVLEHLKVLQILFHIILYEMLIFVSHNAGREGLRKRINSH